MLFPFEVLGTIAFAISGILAADRRDMDLVGVFTVACTTAFGGGTIRDLILDRSPVYWIEHSALPASILVLCIASRFVGLSQRIPPGSRILTLADAVGLGVFSATGALVAAGTGTSLFIAALLGVVTGTFGGVLRDIICNDVPILFRKETLYATCALAGSTVTLAIDHYTIDQTTLAITAGTTTVTLTRLLALKFNWRLTRPPQKKARPSAQRLKTKD